LPEFVAERLTALPSYFLKFRLPELLAPNAKPLRWSVDPMKIPCGVLTAGKGGGPANRGAVVMAGCSIGDVRVKLRTAGTTGTAVVSVTEPAAFPVTPTGNRADGFVTTQ